MIEAPLLSSSRLIRMDGRVKLVAALSCTVNLMLARSIIFPIVVAGVCLLGLRRVRMRLLLSRFSMVLGPALVLGVLQTLLHGTTALAQFHVFGHLVRLTREGLLAALLLDARILASTSALLLLSSTTPWSQILGAMRWLRVPDAWVDVAMLTARYALVLTDTARTVADAARLRLGRAGLRPRLAWAGMVVGAVFLRSMEQSAMAHQALVLRGYHEHIPAAPNPPLGRSGRFAFALAVAAPTACMLLARALGVP